MTTIVSDTIYHCVSVGVLGAVGRWLKLLDSGAIEKNGLLGYYECY
jgi:hypothetical protein